MECPKAMYVVFTAYAWSSLELTTGHNLDVQGVGIGFMPLFATLEEAEAFAGPGAEASVFRLVTTDRGD